MTRKKSTTLTEFEQRIMNILWRKKEISVREATEILSTEGPVAYTTVLTMFKILKDKGYVQYRKQGKAFIYHAIVNQTEARKSALSKLIDQLFNGSPEILAQHLMTENHMDLAELRALKKAIDDADEGA
ncbi:MAG: BlaI/MecI/CopY family transcriptional regulator [Emcibacter sp.]|nr:BlaI/MecI/CopY family transcriptional regulator [Emcibacter sp.]